MLRRWLVSGCLTVLAAAGCSSSSEPVSLTISPGGTVQVNGPTELSAKVQGSLETPTWNLEGPGSLSGTTGTHVVYTPPVTLPADPHATLHASVAGASATVELVLGVATVTSATVPELTADVTVLYDSKQIPHIQCEQVNDCIAVQGYLHARDRLFQMDFMRRLARGRLAELVGVAGLSQDVQLRTLFTTRDGRRLEEALADAIDAETRPKIEAYVRGINAYLATLKGDPSVSLPGEYAQLPYAVTAADIPDWTVADVTALARLQQFELSESLGEETDYGRFAATYGPGAPHEDTGKMNAWIRSAQPVGAQAHTLDTLTATSTLAPRRAGALQAPASDATRKSAKAPEVRSAPPAPPLVASRSALSKLGVELVSLENTLRPLDGSVGSNNWAVDAAHSANGKAMVANDPHLSLQYPPNFYLMALTSSNPADNLDITGGAFPGVPGALVGRGKNVGWGVTVVGYDVTDIYVEQVEPCPAGTPAAIPFCVSFNGQAMPVRPVPTTWKVRMGPGDAGLVDAQTLPEAQRPPQAIIIVSPHGPLIQAPDATGMALSVRWTGQESWTQDLRAFLGLDTATNVDTAMAALNDYATGAQNFVLADEAGHIAYYPHALVPVRKFADPYAVGTSGLRPPWLPLPGDGTAEWGTGDAADHCDGLDYSAIDPSKGVLFPTPVTPAAACWIANDKLPQGKDPAQGFFATANSDPTSVSDSNNPFATQPYLSFDWGDPTGLRITRIAQLLEAKLAAGGGTVSLADMEAIQSDHVSLLGELFAGILASSAFDTAASGSADFAAARGMLTSWAEGATGPSCPTGLEGIDPASSPADPDSTVTANSAACYLFHTFLRDLVTNVFADDLAVAGLGVSGGPALRGILYMLQPDTPVGDQSFCDDVDKNGAVTASHTCGEQVVTALVQAYRTLSGTLGDTSNWRWGRVHTMQPVSLFPLVTTGYEPGPYARPGGAFTVDVGNPSLAGGSTSFSFNSSGNVRHISVMDAAAPVVRMQLPGPERDLPSGVFEGPDLLGEWVRNQYFDYATSSQIDAAAVASQSFQAQ